MPITKSNRSLWVFVLITSMLGLVACASGGRRQDALSCIPRVFDTTFAAGRMLYHECGVDNPAKLLVPNLRPNFVPSPTRANMCYLADLEFVVDTAGSPELETARVTNVSDRSYGEALLQMLPALTYEPARLQGRPVRQLVVLHRSTSAQEAVVPGITPRRPRPFSCS